jgi:hypothetical protein
MNMVIGLLLPFLYINKFTSNLLVNLPQIIQNCLLPD